MSSSVQVPKTPSRTINEMLQTRCGKVHENPVVNALSIGICRYFSVTNQVYGMIHPDQSQHSHRMWMASCAIVSLVLVLVSYLGYHAIVALSFIAHSLLYYASYSAALLIIALGVSGAVFFDKEGDASPGSPSKSTSSSIPSETKYD